MITKNTTARCGAKTARPLPQSSAHASALRRTDPVTAGGLFGPQAKAGTRGSPAFRRESLSPGLAGPPASPRLLIVRAPLTALSPSSGNAPIISRGREACQYSRGGVQRKYDRGERPEGSVFPDGLSLFALPTDGRTPFPCAGGAKQGPRRHCRSPCGVWGLMLPQEASQALACFSRIAACAT